MLYWRMLHPSNGKQLKELTVVIQLITQTLNYDVYNWDDK